MTRKDSNAAYAKYVIGFGIGSVGSALFGAGFFLALLWGVVGLGAVAWLAKNGSL